jgi:hypothetical protein
MVKWLNEQNNTQEQKQKRGIEITIYILHNIKKQISIVVDTMRLCIYVTVNLYN